MKFWILFVVTMHGPEYPIAYYQSYSDCEHAARYVQTMGTDAGAFCSENWMKPTERR